LKQSDAGPPAKRRKIGKSSSKSKGKKPVHCTDDELEESTQNNSEDNDNSTTEEANVKGARYV